MSKNVKLDLTITKSTSKSKRYQTKRRGEVRSRDEEGKRLMKELEFILLNPSNYEDDMLEVYQKRYRSLCQKYRKKTPRDYNQLHIPFRLDRRTVVYIRQKHLYKTKWVKRLGLKRIKQRQQDYLDLLHKKPEGRIFWNPFID